MTFNLLHPFCTTERPSCLLSSQVWDFFCLPNNNKFSICALLFAYGLKPFKVTHSSKKHTQQLFNWPFVSCVFLSLLERLDRVSIVCDKHDEPVEFEMKMSKTHKIHVVLCDSGQICFLLAHFLQFILSLGLLMV